MQVLPFHKKLIVIATVLAAGQAFSSEGQKFDVQALEGLGFGAEVSEYFSKYVLGLCEDGTVLQAKEEIGGWGSFFLSM